VHVDSVLFWAFTDLQLFWKLLFLEDAKSVSNFAVFSDSFLVNVFGFFSFLFGFDFSLRLFFAELRIGRRSHNFVEKPCIFVY